jgi:hypothetical protein
MERLLNILLLVGTLIAIGIMFYRIPTCKSSSNTVAYYIGHVLYGGCPDEEHK